MDERLLQFIWQFQHFNKEVLYVESGETLSIIHPGSYNSHQGPDFTNAKIIIGNTVWAGNIEIHINSSDWLRHGHSSDKNYSNIILHVVWVHDVDISYTEGIILPTLSLHERVSKLLLDRFKELMMQKAFVPCELHLPVMDKFKWTIWTERLAIERLQRKASIILSLLNESGNHWEEVFWWMLARNFGMKVNADIFESIARSLSLSILGKHKQQIHQIESFLLGQAGLLQPEFDEDYPRLLKREYLFYQKKYSLKEMPVKPFFLRMRPANFPTVRLAQLAMLINQSSHLFSTIKETPNVNTIKDLLNITANDYWHYHYKFDDLGEYQPKRLGTQMTENVIINTVTPVLFAYAWLHSDSKLKNKSIEWLTQISSEKNALISKWTSFRVPSNNALESQGLIELKNSYCNPRKCLACAVGNSILKGV